MSSQHQFRCLICDEKFSAPDKSGNRLPENCPKCGHILTAMNPEKDVEIKINWSELVMLIIWANAHTRCDPRSNAAMKSITERIRRQHPQLYAESHVNFV